MSRIPDSDFRPHPVTESLSWNMYISFTCIGIKTKTSISILQFCSNFLPYLTYVRQLQAAKHPRCSIRCKAFAKKAKDSGSLFSLKMRPRKFGYHAEESSQSRLKIGYCPQKKSVSDCTESPPHRSLEKQFHI